MATVPSHWVKLVQLVAHAFYAGDCPPHDAADPEAPKGPRKGTNVSHFGTAPLHV